MRIKTFLSKLLVAWKSENASHRIVLVAIFVGGIGMRVPFLFQPIMHDESYTYVHIAYRPLSYILTHNPASNNHMLHNILVHFSTRLFGNDTWAIRLPAFIAGVLLVPAAYLVGRKLFDKRAGILAAALVASTSFMIEYSTNARGHSMLALAFLMLILAAISLKRTDSAGAWVAFVCFAVLGFYTVPTNIYFFASTALWLLISALLKDTKAPPKKFILKLAVASAVTAVTVILLYLPVLIVSGLSAFKTPPENWTRTFHALFKGLPANMKDIWTNWNSGIPLVVSLIIAAGFVVSVVFFRKIARDRVNLPIVAACVCLLAMIGQKTLLPARIWIPLWLLFLISSSAGLVFAGSSATAFLSKRMGRHAPERAIAANVTALFVVVLLGAVTVGGQFPYQPKDQLRFRNAEQVAKYLQKELQPGDVVYVEPNLRKPLEYYFLKYGVPMDYLFILEMPQTGKREVKRAFLIADPKDGFPLQKTLDATNIEKGVITKDPVASFPNSGAVYIMKDVTLRKP